MNLKCVILVEACQNTKYGYRIWLAFEHWTGRSTH